MRNTVIRPDRLAYVNK